MSATAEEVAARGCEHPIYIREGMWVRCGSRVKSRCESCAELYRGDWAAIARSGVFDGPVQNYRFYLLTLTAPSFGEVHRVPKHGTAPPCRCGVVHSVEDVALRGVPLSFAAYDYAGQVRWNRDSGTLWTNTIRRLRDRWLSVEFFVVREWQDRGVLHVHALLRVARGCAPEPAVLRDAAQSAIAVSKVDGTQICWGAQAKCDAFVASADGAKTIWYLSKAVNYVLKDVLQDAGRGRQEILEHHARLAAAARAMPCGPDCDPHNCNSRVHQRYGSRAQVVSQSRRTTKRSGWSFTGLNRTVQRRLRLEWYLRATADEPAGATVGPQGLARAGVENRLWAATRDRSGGVTASCT